MVVATSARAIPDILQDLLETPPPPDGVLSVFVDTSPTRSFGQAYLLALRDRAKALRAELPADQRPFFDAAVTQAEAILAQSFAPGHVGLAIFASADPTYVFATPLPTRPLDLVRFGERPAIAPLAAAIDDAERAVVLLFDKERTRLFTIFLGEIEERQSFADDVPGKQHTGGWFALSQKRYERHHEDHVLRHAKRTIAALQAERERHPFDRLLLAGPDEAIALLEDHLPRPLRTRLAGTLALELFAREAEVLAAAQSALAAVERRQETEAVRRLLDDAGSPRVAVGPEATLAALSDGRVHRLFISNGSLGGAYECPACGLLTLTANSCPRCGATTRVVPDLRERAIEAAIDSGARVEAVTGEAADLLARHGGIGARTRWA